MKKEKKSNKVYIYNPMQKDFFIQEGCSLITVSTHKSTHRNFWVFKYNKKYINAMKKWCDRNKK